MATKAENGAIRIVPAGKDMFVVMNKHTILGLKAGKAYTVELVSGDRKMKMTFIRDNAFQGVQARLASEKEKMEAGQKLKDIASPQ